MSSLTNIRNQIDQPHKQAPGFAARKVDRSMRDMAWHSCKWAPRWLSALIASGQPKKDLPIKG